MRERFLRAIADVIERARASDTALTLRVPPLEAARASSVLARGYSAERRLDPDAVSAGGLRRDQRRADARAHGSQERSDAMTTVAATSVDPLDPAKLGAHGDRPACSATAGRASSWPSTSESGCAR